MGRQFDGLYDLTRSQPLVHVVYCLIVNILSCIASIGKNTTNIFCTDERFSSMQQDQIFGVKASHVVNTLYVIQRIAIRSAA